MQKSPIRRMVNPNLRNINIQRRKRRVFAHKPRTGRPRRAIIRGIDGIIKADNRRQPVSPAQSEPRFPIRFQDMKHENPGRASLPGF